jgi:hypothetical protein
MRGRFTPVTLNGEVKQGEIQSYPAQSGDFELNPPWGGRREERDRESENLQIIDFGDKY